MITNGMTMNPAELARILIESVTEGTTKVFVENTVLKDRISKADAYRLYGRSQVDRWIAEGLFNPSKKQSFISSLGIDRKKLEAIAAESNRGTYLPVADR